MLALEGRLEFRVKVRVVAAWAIISPPAMREAQAMRAYLLLLFY